MKVLINTKHGGFGISNEAYEAYLTRIGVKFYKWDKDVFGFATYTTVPREEYELIEEEDKSLPIGIQNDGSPSRYTRINEMYLMSSDLQRTDPILISIIEEMGEKANGSHARIKVVEIPDDVKWTIEEYDGIEWVAEVHRTWN